MSKTSLLHENLKLQTETLYPYQLQTVNFIETAFSNHRIYHKYAEDTTNSLNYAPSGVLIGHEPGLGKTVIISHFLFEQFVNKTIKKALIIVPKQLITQWKQHLLSWCSNVPTLVLEGTQAQKQKIYANFKSYTNLILIASYQTLTREITPLLLLPFSILITDESTELKNPKSLNFTSLSKFPSHMFKIALTGTPIMNSLTELFTIIQFAVPNFFGNYALFRRFYIEKIEAKSRNSEVAKECERRIAVKLEEVMLRFKKAQVSGELSGKREVIVWVDEVVTQTDQTDETSSSTAQIAHISSFSPQNFHQNRQNDLQISQFIGDSESQIDDSTLQTDLSNQHSSISQLNNRTKKTSVSSSKQLISLQTTTPLVIQQITALRQITELQKVNFLVKFCEFFAKNDLKTLVFAENLKTLKTINQRIPSLIITGDTPPAERDQIQTLFHSNSSPKTLLLSMKIGSMGLNLQSAERVLIVSPCWNPQVEEQAVARAWRLGNAKEVVVYRLVCRGTIDEKVLQRGLYKRGLTQVVGGKEQFDVGEWEGVLGGGRTGLEIEGEGLGDAGLLEELQGSFSESNVKFGQILMHNEVVEEGGEEGGGRFQESDNKFLGLPQIDSLRQMEQKQFSEVDISQTQQELDSIFGVCESDNGLMLELVREESVVGKGVGEVLGVRSYLEQELISDDDGDVLDVQEVQVDQNDEQKRLKLEQLLDQLDDDSESEF